MKTQGYTSVYEIIERVMDTFPSEDITFSAMVRFISDGLLLIGAPTLLDRKEFEIELKNYKAKLPCEIRYIHGVRYKSTPLRYSSNVYHAMISKENKDYFSKNEYSYVINGEYIATNIECDTIVIAADTVLIDDNGYPLIPDEIRIKEFLTYHVLWKLSEGLYLMDKLTRDKFEYIARERDFYAGAATNAAVTPSPDEMETIKNMMVRLIEEPLSHSKYFDNVGYQEKRRKF